MPEDLHIARGSKSARDGSGNARRLRERAGWQWHAGMWLLHTTVEHRCLALALWAVLVPLALSRREVEVLLHQSLQCLPSRLWVQGYSVPLFNPGSDVIAGFAR